MDWIGSWTLSLSVTALMLGLSIGPNVGWSSAWTVGLFVASVALLAGFVHRIRHARNPLIPAAYFRRRNFVMPLIVRACANFAYFGAFFLFPLLMEKGYGYSIPRVGAIAIARPLIFAISSPVAGYLAVRIGERVSASRARSSLPDHSRCSHCSTPSTKAWIVVFALALSGLGMGTSMPSSSSVMANEVQPSEFGVMSAAQLLAMQVGEVAGIQVLETVQQALERRRGLLHAKPGPALLATFHLPFLIGACVAARRVGRGDLHALARTRTRSATLASRPVGLTPMTNSDYARLRALFGQQRP